MVKKIKSKCSEGLLIPAGLFIGIGVGMILGNVAAGTLIGLGAGFYGMFKFSNKKK